MKRLFSSFALMALMTACSQNESEVDKFQGGASTLRGAAFGLANKEVVLTLDDGPSPSTVGIARFLQKRNVPATFFVNYANGAFGVGSAEGRARLRALCAMKFHSIGNHSDNHNLSVRSWSEINDVHKALVQDCPQDFYFLRSPGGNWVAGDDSNLNPITDQWGRMLKNLYVGPIYWDIGGDAPWADWHATCQKNLATCRNQYISQTDDAGRGIILAHDIHNATAELLLGSNWKAQLADPNAADNGDGLIARLQNKGYRFVRLDKDKSAVEKWLGRPINPSTEQKGALIAAANSILKVSAAGSGDLPDDQKCAVGLGTILQSENIATNASHFVAKSSVIVYPSSLSCPQSLKEKLYAYVPHFVQAASCTISSSDGSANLRNGASSSATVLAQVPSTSAVFMTGQEGDFAKVEAVVSGERYGAIVSKPAYIHRSLLQCP